MNDIKMMPLQYALQRVRTIPKRVWVAGAGVVLILAALIVWAGIALLGAAWSQLPRLTEVGKRSLESAVLAADQAMPGFSQHAQTLLADLGQPMNAARPAADVSGSDIGPVARFTGLVREQFDQQPGRTSVHYVGQAALPTVLAHYTEGFAAAGFTQTVLSAAPDRERHRFHAEGSSAAYELILDVRPDRTLAVTLTEITP